MDNNLTQLTKDHRRTMLLLNEAEHWLDECYHPDQTERLQTVIQELTDTAEVLTGRIHDLKTDLDNHDCGNSPMDGCTCNLYREEGYARD